MCDCNCLYVSCEKTRMTTKCDQRKHRKTKALLQLNTHSGRIRSVNYRSNTPFVIHLDSEKGSRSSRKNQWIDFYNEEDEEQCYEEYDEESQMQYDIQAQWNEIEQAIDENNADLLYSLLPPVNLFNTKEKYWSNDFYWK